jgi:hypothetical protein
MEELRSARQRWLPIYENVYRLERMHRYVYWLAHREHPKRNLFGSWIDPEIVEETKLWRSLASKDIDEDRIVEELRAMVEQEYSRSTEEAERLASDPELASLGLPIWNSHVQALLPQTLGPLRLASTKKYSDDAHGQSYLYRHADHQATATLFVYPTADAGTDDPRTRKAFLDSSADIEQNTVANRRVIGWTKPTIGAIGDIHDGGYPVISVWAETAQADDTRYRERLVVSGWCGRILKLRLTMAANMWNNGDAEEAVRSIDRDLDEFLRSY